MKDKKFDVIIIGGSYSGLSAALALGRALQKVLIIDSGKPCNIQTPHSHNFITQDGKTPHEISTLARQQVEHYKTVTLMNDLAISGAKTEGGFEIKTQTEEVFTAKKLIFAAGIRDIMPDIPGFSACWGISALHCPYCHGYEVRNLPTGILGNGDSAFEFAQLISNWTKDLTVFTNGKSILSVEQTARIRKHNIRIEEKEIDRLEHANGHLQYVVLKDSSTIPLSALYARLAFEQHTAIPQTLGCAMTNDGYIAIDNLQKTSVPGIFACGDSTNKMRSLAAAVASGTMAGASSNREIVFEEF